MKRELDGGEDKRRERWEKDKEEGKDEKMKHE